MAGLLFLGYWFRPDTRVVACTHVVHGSPPALIAHHRDGDIQVLCDRPHHTKEEAGFVDLANLLFATPDLADAPEVRPGEWATREGIEPWRVERNPEE